MAPKWPELPLGKNVVVPERPAPELLVGIERALARAELGLKDALPFRGLDLWNAYELSWLDARGRPRVAIAEWQISAESPRIPESKSVKLYLQSFALSRFDSAEAVRARIAADLSQTCGASVAVALVAAHGGNFTLGELAGEELDDASAVIERYEDPQPSILKIMDEEAAETLVFHGFRSLCPITAQPDHASLQIRYRGPRFERAALLRYLCAFRRHRDFHEACIERIFVDLWNRAHPRELTVYGRFCRRGGIDINPFRTSLRGLVPENPRLSRQ